MKKLDSETVIMTLRVPKKLSLLARVEAARKNQSRSELVRLALMDYLKKQAAGGEK